MTMYPNLMIDIETLSTLPNAMILSIGAVFFDPEVGIGPTFYEKIDTKSSQAHGCHISVDTVLWWMLQSETARLDITNDADQSLSLPETLRLFTRFIDRHSDRKKVLVWGNGSDFDNVIVAHAYSCTSIGQDAPWKFYNNRCYRTLKNLYPNIKMERTGTHHNALDDARSQAIHAIEILKFHGRPSAETTELNATAREIARS